MKVYPFIFLGDFVKIKSISFDILSFVVGGMIYSVAVTCFLSPNKIAPGGVTGIATMLNFLFSFPIGGCVLVINLPLLAVGFFCFGKGFILKTAVATIISSLMLDMLKTMLPAFHIDNILASVFGGSLMGLGISIVMLRGSTTGGADIVAKLINRRFPYVGVGRILLFVDACVIALSALVYKNTQSALYSIISLYASARIMDLMLYGADKGKIVYIISSKTQDIVSDILNVVNRGVTVIDVVGGYMGDKRKMIMCTVRRNEVHEVCKYARKRDNKAFIVVAEAGEIIGEGFKK